MATVSDTLTTVLSMVGGSAYAAQMGLAAKASDGLAAAEVRQATTSGALRQAFSALGGSTLLAAGELTAYAAILAQSVRTSAEDEAQVFRTTVVLRNLGNSYPIAKAQAFASSLQKTIAIDDEAVVSLIGLEKRFGVADSQIESTAKTILDFAKGTGESVPEAGEKVLRAMLGQTRGLRALGIQMVDTGDKAQNLAIIQQKLNGLFGGAAAAERNTLSGSFVALKESLSNLLSAVGDKLSTVLIPALNATTKVMDFLTDHAYLATAALGAAIGNFFGGPVGALIGGIAGLGLGLIPSRANAAEKVGGGGGGLATESTLSKIEANTGKTMDAIIKSVLGGSGVIARQAFTFRDAHMALRI